MNPSRSPHLMHEQKDKLGPITLVVIQYRIRKTLNLNLSGHTNAAMAEVDHMLLRGYRICDRDKFLVLIKLT